MLKPDKHQQIIPLEVDDSLLQISEKLVTATKNIMRTADTEEDLRIGFEKALEPLCNQLGVQLHPKYERSVYGSGRRDALHGLVIIEYENPGAFKSEKWIDHAFGQLINYINGEAKEKKETLFIFDPTFVGIGFDGEKVFFVQYRGDKNKPKLSLDKEDFTLLGPFPFDSHSARTLLTYLRALSRRLLTAENLAEVFGPASKIAPAAVSALADALKNWGNERVRVFFKEWKRLFGIVYGEHFGAQGEDQATALSRLYGVAKDVDFQELLFSVHTYFALLMKLIAAEIISLRESAFTSSLSQKLTHASKKELKAQLTDIEEGWIYSKRGITNYLEGDFFRWYLDAFSLQLEEALRDTARGLSEFEPATTIIRPEATRDLIKKLYQYLVPQEVRHNLGEFYTPDWLAELTLDEVGYDGNSQKRLLDPACGSGTFLVLAIQRAKHHAKINGMTDKEAALTISANIWGFDLNPLAVIAARTNYLFAFGNLIEAMPSFEIPIYLADSVLWPERNGQLELTPQGESVGIATSIQKFFVPRIWVQNKGFLMKTAAPLVEKMVKAHYTVEEALKLLTKEGLLTAPHEPIVKSFYGELLQLEKEGRNGIWARFLKNAFAPMTAGRFDFVVGNPPWIRWGYLSQEYRAATLPLWQQYGLFSLKGHAARLGGGEKDFSMLFTYAAADYYLDDRAKLGFLITQEVFKSKGAGEGFRRFHWTTHELGNEEEHLKVLKAHDLVTVQPFEGAANKTAMIIIKKGAATIYPLPYTLWSRKKGVGRLPTDALLKDVLPLLKKQKLLATPIGTPTGQWQTVSEDQKELEHIKGTSLYQARRGASTEPYGVFWLDIKQVLANGNIIVRNMSQRGKKTISQEEVQIEPDLVFPLLSGADIKRWNATPKHYLLMSQDPETREPYPESEFKENWPRTYGYLTKFRGILLARGSKTVRQLAERTAFYAMFGIGPYTLARYKVVWKRMANDIVAAVISQSKAEIGYKMIVPSDTTAFFSVDNEDEAHYLCAIVNSGPVRQFIKTYSAAGRGFGAPSVMSHVGIPKFDDAKRLHRKLSELSRKLHEAQKTDKQTEITKLEAEVDVHVNRLFGIHND